MHVGFLFNCIIDNCIVTSPMKQWQTLVIGAWWSRFVAVCSLWDTFRISLRHCSLSCKKKRNPTNPPAWELKNSFANGRSCLSLCLNKDVLNHHSTHSVQVMEKVQLRPCRKMFKGDQVTNPQFPFSCFFWVTPVHWIWFVTSFFTFLF